MSGRYPAIVHTEEDMREGMQIEDANIPIKALYDMNAPFVETLQQATHFKRGPEVYAGAIYPWKEPIASPYRERVEQGLPPFEVHGDWPWNEAFFPKPSAIMGSEPR